MQNTTIGLRSIRSLHIGGTLATLSGLPAEQRRFARHGPSRAVDPNGDHITGQMYVQSYLLAEPRFAVPVLLWHGGGMTGANWESTPDGRPGWLDRFLRAGFDVYVSDAVERGRSSWSPWPGIYDGPPIWRTMGEGWDMFRIGPAGSYQTRAAERQAHDGTQFPVEAFDDFAAQWVPRWTDHDEQTLAAYDALLERVGECIVVGHSQGGGFALEAVRRRPAGVRAVVAIEPSGAPQAVPLESEASSAAPSVLPPHLVVWGDYTADHPTWARYRANVDAYGCALDRARVAVTTLDLPRDGVRGNSHFPMLDRNSDAVADRVIDWLARNARA